MKPHFLVFTLPFFLLFSGLYLKSSSHSPQPTSQVLAAEEDIFFNDIPYSLSYNVTSGDARPIIIRNYLHRYRSPLEPLATKIVEISDQYKLDYRLLVAIARQESGLCKVIPENSYNCWGYGIYGDKVTRFDSYEQGLEIVAKGLKRNYIDRGLVTPEEIMAKYTPPSLEKGGAWAKGVNQFFSELE